MSTNGAATSAAPVVTIAACGSNPITGKEITFTTTEMKTVITNVLLKNALGDLHASSISDTEC